MTHLKKLQITMGAIPYLWSGEKWRDFYYGIADSEHVDAVTLGEVVCSKRDHFIRPFLAEVIERLQRNGKNVAIGSLALVTMEREVIATRRLATGSLPVEANDLSALRLLVGRPHQVGPFVNVYNGATARLLARKGATRICLGPELPATSIASIIKDAPGIEFEIIAFGRLPLAISARCAHARAKHRSKDNCQFVCGEDEDGLDVDTLDGQAFLSINGVQTTSRHCQVLLGEMEMLRDIGVTHLRLSPQNCDMETVASIFAQVRDEKIDVTEGLARLRDVYSAAPYANGFLHGNAGMNWVA
ncbi:ubiquinone anaerobic biosynthesis protein UbiV [Castellaniella sp.]|uniref:ubiquinone anaerobic biosynthesis protein UbiV n=1 Tax=Castellaniella sp. TaxID=1955812 RepID=UPI002AFF4CA1|nr:U32 family peptidase [Castellaniella sp.]